MKQTFIKTATIALLINILHLFSPGLASAHDRNENISAKQSNSSNCQTKEDKESFSTKKQKRHQKRAFRKKIRKAFLMALKKKKKMRVSKKNEINDGYFEFLELDYGAIAFWGIILGLIGLLISPTMAIILFLVPLGINLLLGLIGYLLTLWLNSLLS